MVLGDNRVLVCGAVPAEAVSLLAKQVTVDELSGDCCSSLAEVVGPYHGLVVAEDACLTAEVLRSARELRVIGCIGQAIERVDVEAATGQGVVVLSSPGSTASAAEYAVGLLLALARRIPQAYESLRGNRWERSRFVGVQVRRRTLGLIGLGQTGSEVARRARGLEMRVLARDPFVSPDYARSLSVDLVNLDDLLQSSDFVSLHVPLTSQTAGLIGKRELGLMRKGAHIINTSAPEVVDYEAALTALDEGYLCGLATDILPENVDVAGRLLSHPRVVVTPRLSAWTSENQTATAVDVAGDTLNVLAGRPAKLSVNTVVVAQEAFASLGPYVLLAEHLGRLLSQISEGCWRQTEVAFQGEVAQGDTAPLLSAAAAGILKEALPERANLANALLLARSRGMSIVERKDQATPEKYANLVTLKSPAPHFVEDVAGTVIEGRPCVVRLGRYWVSIFPTGGYLFLSRSLDRPGIMGRVGSLLGQAGIRFSSLQLGRRGPEGQALMVMRLEDPVPPALMPELLEAAGAVDGRLVVF